jgi:DNA-binding transcriptional regulator LsrR (DeoR family)
VLSSAQHEDDQALLARACWLYFAGGMTHGEIGDRLGVPSFKVQRLIARATREGMIHIFIDSPVADCVRLEHALAERYGLAECVVSPDLGEDTLPLRSLAPAGARYLMRVIEDGKDRLVGLGHGRTISAIVEGLPRQKATQTAFVALLGGLTTSYSADPYDVIHRISDRTGVPGYFLPVPFFANTAADREVLSKQIGVSHVMQMARQTTLCLVGIGTATREGFLAQTGAIDEDDLAALERLGARSEILCYFHDAEGRPVETGLAERSLTLTYEELRGRRIIAAAGGADKVEAIRSVLRSGLLSGLITDEATARALVGEQASAVTPMRLRLSRKRSGPDAAKPDTAKPGGARPAGTDARGAKSSGAKSRGAKPTAAAE